MESQTWYRTTVIWKHTLKIAQLHLCHRSLLCLLTHSSVAISSHVLSGMDGLRTVPFWLCLASGCLHLKTWLRKPRFMKYSGIEQDHIKHFLPFHTGFGTKFCIECFSIFSYLWPGSKTKSSRADSLCASGPTEASSNAPLCETRLSYRSVPEYKKHSQEFKYNSASSSTCKMHFFAFSSIKTQQHSKCIWNDQNNAFNTIPPLGGRGEDKEVSHVVYCSTGKWVMVGNVTDEWDWETWTD